MSINLRNYQKDASENSSRIFNSDSSFNRLSCLVLPTGGGKSFVAIDQIIKFNNDSQSISNNGPINTANILYLAPTLQILNQIKVHIVKHVLNLDIKKLSLNDIDKLVNNAFPNLKLKCYAGIKDAEKEDSTQDSDILNADLIVADEAHRLGAESWGKNFYSQLKHNKKAKILAITATPDRTDDSGKNMLEDIARNIYDRKVPDKSDYIAKEIYLMDAIKDGICVAPESITSSSAYVLSDEYQSILKAYNSDGISKERKEELGSILTQIDELIGFSGRDELFEEKRVRDIQNTLAQNIDNKNGKYVFFIPHNKGKSGDDILKDSSDYFKQYYDKLREFFKDVKDENGNPVKLNISFVTSNTSIKVDKDGNPTNDKHNGFRVNNSQVIKEFEEASNESGGIKILITNDMLNEGVHVDGINGVIMYRNIISGTTYSQQTGRCISSSDPNLPIEFQNKVKVIDLVGNSIKQINDRTGQKTSYSYDLEKMLEIVKWNETHAGKFPSINASYKESSSNEEKVFVEKELRLAIATERLKSKYMLSKSGAIYNAQNKDTIELIVELANKINLWDYESQERNPSLEPSLESLQGKGFLVADETHKKFMELYYRANLEKEVNLTTQVRIKKCINILRVLTKLNPNIDLTELSSNISLRVNDDVTLRSSGFKVISLGEFIDKNFKDEDKKYVYDCLKDIDAQGAIHKREIYRDGDERTYDLGEEIGFLKGKFYTSEFEYSRRDGKDLFDGYQLKDLLDIGLVSKFGIADDIESLKKMSQERANINVKADKNSKLISYTGYTFDRETGFFAPGKHINIDNINVNLMDKFREYSFITGEKRPEESRKKELIPGGYDKSRISKFEERDGIYYCKTTNEPYDEDGYDFYGYDDKGYDVLGYDRDGYDINGFEKPSRPKISRDGVIFEINLTKPCYHRKNIDGSYDTHGYEYKDDIDYFGFNKKDKKPNERGFYPNGTRAAKPQKKTQFGAKLVYYDANDLYDENGIDIYGFDRSGFKEVVLKSGKKVLINRETATNLDELGQPSDKAKKINLANIRNLADKYKSMPR